MGYQEVSDADCACILRGLAALQGSASLKETAVKLVEIAPDLVECDHGGYSEVDLHFGRTESYCNIQAVKDWVARRADLWSHFMPTHPVLRHRIDNPDVAVAQLSQVTDIHAFYNGALYNELFREVDTNHQFVIHLGTNPRVRYSQTSCPLSWGAAEPKRQRL